MAYFSRWRFANWWGLIFWVGSVLRLYQIGAAPRWYDEIFTTWLGSLPLAQMWSATAGDVHPPGYYFLIWTIEHLAGDANWLLRLPSALLGIAALPLLALIGRRLKLSDGAILAATALMALSPLQIYFSQETRMYTLLQAAILLAVLAVLDRRWWLLAIANTLMVYTHNYSWLYLAVILALAAAREMRQPVRVSLRPDYLRDLPWRSLVDAANFRALALSAIVPVICYFPWLREMLGQLGAVNSWWQQPTTLGSAIEPVNRFLWDVPQGMLNPICQIITYSLVAFALIKVLRLKSAAGLQIALLTFAPMGISLATELVIHPTFLFRSFVGSAPFLYLLLGWALTERVSVPLQRLTFGALAPLFAVVLISYYPILYVIKQGAPIQAPTLSPGDIVYHMNPGSLLDWRNTYPTQTGLYAYVSPNLPGNIGVLSPRTIGALGVVQAPLAAIPWRRAWLVWSAGPTISQAEDDLVDQLTRQYDGQLVSEKTLYYSKLYKVQLWLLQSNSD